VLWPCSPKPTELQQNVQIIPCKQQTKKDQPDQTRYLRGFPEHFSILSELLAIFDYVKVLNDQPHFLICLAWLSKLLSQ